MEMMIMQSAVEQDRFDLAKNLIIEAGDLALQYFGNLSTLSIMSKGARDMVSEADFAVEKLIKERLLARYPDDAYLGEETGTPRAARIQEPGSSIRLTALSPSSAA
jgi:myo-inositol-1(or 4)-monophosphatase